MIATVGLILHVGGLAVVIATEVYRVFRTRGELTPR
jgi:hypothetical protein